MRLLKHPTRKIFRKQKKRKKPHPTVSFPMFTVKKGRDSSASRKGGVGELLDFRQPDSAGGGEGTREEKGDRGEGGAIKTLTAHLVYGAKKAPHAQQAPGLRAHTAPRVAGAHQLQALSPSLHRSARSRAGAAAAVAVAVAAAGLRLTCWSQCRGRGGWTGHVAGVGEEEHGRLISNKKENSSLYTVVCFGSVQTE